MTADGAEVSKSKAYAASMPPSVGVSISKFEVLALTAPPLAGVSEAKLRALAASAPPFAGVSEAKLRVYALVTEKVIIVPDYFWPVANSQGSPSALLVPEDAKLIVNPANTVGGISIGGVQQSIGNSPGRWRLDLSKIRVKSGEERMAWEVLEAALCGQANTVGVPLYRWMKDSVPWPTIAGVLTTSAPGYGSPVIEAYSNAQCLEGSVTIDIRMEVGAALISGHVFGFNYKVYRIIKIVSATTTPDSPFFPVYTVKFWPPLRERIEQDDRLDFDNPIMRCRLLDDNQMAVQGGWSKWKRGSPDVSFVEDVTTEAPASP